MHEALKLILKEVDLNGYSRSKNFQGFFEFQTNVKIEKSTKLSLNILRSFKNKFWVVSCLRDSDKILEVNNDTLFDNEDNDIFNALIKKLDISNKNDLDKAEKIIKGVFNEGMFGYIFFVYLEKNLIIYPHDDIGLGFIAPEAEKGKIQTILDQYLDKQTFKFFNKRTNRIQHQ